MELILGMGSRQNIIALLLTLSLTTISACGGTVDENPVPPTTPQFVESPSEGGLVSPNIMFEFAVTNTSPELTPGALYSFTVYDDEGMINELESVSDYTEDAVGVVRWASDVRAYDNRAYWWRWSVTYNGEKGPITETSELLTVRVKRVSYMQAASPRNSGYMDFRNTDAPRLAVWNLYTGDSGVDIKYDFELYRDAGMTDLALFVEDVAQQSSEIYTAWSVDTIVDSFTVLQSTEFLPAPIAEPAEGDTGGAGSSSGGAADIFSFDIGTTYYWRAREVVEGVEGNWTETFSFSVVDICEISGSRYASYITEVTPARYCTEIAFTDTSQALGPPNAGGNSDSSYHGFVSIDISGILGVEMGRTVHDGPGNDIMIYEYWANEPIELFAALSEIGPWYSLGYRWCDPVCAWNLNASPLHYARYFRIMDGWSLPDACHATSGSDIDSVVALNVVTDPVINCGGY